jgi:hypothetical protein
MKDYLGNEIHIGDTVLYVDGTTTDYPYSKGIVTEFIKRKGYSRFEGNTLIDYVVYQGVCRKGYRQGHSLINLTALGLRSRGDVNAAE